MHDLTFGEGRFHVIPRERGVVEFLVGVDIQVLNWVVKPDVFIPKPLQKKETLGLLKKLGPFDVLVIDPPFYTHQIRGWETRPHYFHAFGRPQFLLEEGYRIAAELGVPYVISHFNNARFNTSSYEHRIEVRFKPIIRRMTDITSYYWLSRLEGKAAPA